MMQKIRQKALWLAAPLLALGLTYGAATPAVAQSVDRAWGRFTTLIVSGVAKFADGTVAAPSIAFAAATGTGWNRDTATGNVRLSIGGSTVGTFTSGGTFTAPGEIIATTGMYPGGYAILNATGRVSWGGRSSLYSGSNGNVQVTNAEATNTYDITLADWGTTLSAESISVVSGGVLFLGAAPFGTLEVQIGTDNRICRFELVGTSNATAEERDGGNICSAAKDTAISINVYYDAAGASGAGYYLQNLRGGTRAVRLALIGA